MKSVKRRLTAALRRIRRSGRPPRPEWVAPAAAAAVDSTSLSETGCFAPAKESDGIRRRRSEPEGDGPDGPLAAEEKHDYEKKDAEGCEKGERKVEGGTKAAEKGAKRLLNQILTDPNARMHAFCGMLLFFAILISQCHHQERGSTNRTVSAMYEGTPLKCQELLILQDPSGAITKPAYICTAAAGSLHFDDGIEAKIYGGDRAPEGRFPYAVSLRNEFRVHVCTGILISPQFVLTAAHCVDKGPGTLGPHPVAYLGAYNMDDDEHTEGVKVVRVVNTFLHPNYMHNYTTGWDLALAELREQVFEVKFPQLADESEKYEVESFSALGWGSIDSSVRRPDVLQIAETLKLGNKDKCKRRFPKIQEHQLCLRAPQNGSPCGGDSGGPIFIPDAHNGSYEKGFPENDIIIAVTSFGEHCSKTDSLGLYINVASVKDWILQVMKERTGENKGTTNKANTTRVVLAVVGAFLIGLAISTTVILLYCCWKQRESPKIPFDAASKEMTDWRESSSTDEFDDPAIMSAKQSEIALMESASEMTTDDVEAPEPQTGRGTLIMLAQDVLTFVKENSVDSALREKAKDLYHRGRQLVLRHFRGQSIIAESVLPVVVVLNEVMRSLHEDLLLLHVLCKTYRIFVEVLWYQCSNEDTAEQESWPISQNVLGPIVRNAKSLIGQLQKNGNIDIKFELQCIEQAVKCLPSVANPRPVNVNSPGQQISALETIGKWKSFFFAVQYSHGSNVASWYLEVQYLREAGMSIETDEEFTQYISPKIDSFRRKGGKHAVCLVIVLMSIIKNSHKLELRKRAFEGIRNESGLCNVIDWEPSNLPGIMGFKDSLKDARCLAVSYLLKIASNKDENYRCFVEKSWKALEDRRRKVERRINLSNRNVLGVELNRVKKGLNETCDVAVLANLLAVSKLSALETDVLDGITVVQP